MTVERRRHNDFHRRPRDTVVRVVHEPEEGEIRVLATDVETADWMVPQAVGLMFRRSVPEEYALVFPFGRTRRRALHMLFVPFDVDAVWLSGGRVQQVRRLPAWVGFGVATADTIVEFPAGSTDGVEPGDEVRIETEP